MTQKEIDRPAEVMGTEDIMSIDPEAGPGNIPPEALEGGRDHE